MGAARRSLSLEGIDFEGSSPCLGDPLTSNLRALGESGDENGSWRGSSMGVGGLGGAFVGGCFIRSDSLGEKLKESAELPSDPEHSSLEEAAGESLGSLAC